MISSDARALCALRGIHKRDLSSLNLNEPLTDKRRRSTENVFLSSNRPF
jgi:hypothetical protein